MIQMNGDGNTSVFCLSQRYREELSQEIPEVSGDRVEFLFDGGDAGAWRSHANQNFKPNIHEVYSDDLGVSWNLGQFASNQSPGMPNEVQMVELNDGTIMLNARSYKGNHCRKIACSQDEGKTWSLSQTLVKGSFAYSCLVKLSDNEFGILFERDNYSKISFSRKRIDWLLS